MYVPTNIAATGATYAPTAVTPNPAALAQSQATSSVRQTELALTGLAPTLLSNAVPNRQSSSGGTAAQTLLLSPRPAYIAAQFLAQDVSPQEAAQFFAASAKPQAQPQQNDLRDMRIALGLDTGASQQIAIKQSAFASSARASDVPSSLAFASTSPLRTQIATSTLEPVQRQVRRGSIAQTYGEKAYEAANIRNAILASAPEVDTTS